MIQRIQTVYLFVALVLTALCLCLPVAGFEPEGMGSDSVMYNLWITLPDGMRCWSPWPLFAILILSCPICVFAIFSYKNRKTQAKLCMLCLLLNLAWVAVYAVMFYLKAGEDGVETGIIRFAACLPVISIVLYFLARKAIKADEKLVSDMDRLR